MVVGRFCVQRGGRFGLAHIHHGWQDFVIYFNQFGSVFGLLQSFSHHHGHVVAHIANLAVGKDGVGRLVHGFAAGVGDQPSARQAIDLGVDHIGAIEHGHHTRCGQGCCFVDAFDVGVRVGRTHEHRVRHVVQANVVGVVASACEEAVVFLATQGFTDVRKFGKI